MAEKKSIVQVIPSLQQGGVERGTVEIAEACQKAGIKNYVISAGGKMVSEIEALGVEHITLPVKSKNPFTIWMNSYRLAKIFKEKEIALVHVRSRAPAWSVKWACKRLGIPYIATFHGLYGMKPETFKKPYNRVMTQGKLVVAVSSFIHQHLMKDYNVPDQKIRLIPRGADINKFNLNNVTKAQLDDFIAEHDIPTDKPVITLAGRLSRIKGHSLVLDAVQQMKNKDITLLFVGGNAKNKDFEEELNAKIAALPQNITLRKFAVPGNMMPLVYAVTDIYVQPTQVPESFGRSIAEAQAMERIVVAANHGGACELIVNERTGFLIPVSDAKVMAGTFDKILGMTPAEKKAIGKAAAESVRSNFSIQKMCDRTIAMYREFIGRD